MIVKQFYDSLAARQEAKYEKTPSGRNELLLEVARAGQRCFSGQEPVCWIGFNFPPELVLAFDYVPFYAELVPAFLASTDIAQQAIDYTNSMFSNPFCCSYHRASMGEALRYQWPKPAAIVGASGICDGQLKILSLAGRQYDIEPLILELPTTCTEDAVDEVETKLRAIIGKLEFQSGRSLDEEKLRGIVRNSNEVRRQMLRLSQLRQRIPAAFHGFSAFQVSLGMQMWCTSTFDQICSRVAEDIEAEIRSGKAVDEKIRILWMGVWPGFRTNILEILENDFSAHIVIDEPSSVWFDELDESNPVRAIAKKWLAYPLNGSIEKRAAQAKRLVNDFSIDGAIHLSQWGCRQLSGGVGIIRETLASVNVPFLNLDVDAIDSRSYSEGQVSTRLQGFLEMLSERKK